MKKKIAIIVSIAVLLLGSVGADLFAENSAGDFVVTGENVVMAERLMLEMGIDTKGLSEEEIMRKTEELYKQYSGVIAGFGVDVSTYPWFDVILKGWYTGQQANQPVSNPYDYFYQVAAKLNIDITGLTDDEVAAKVKQAEMELQDANAAVGAALYDAAGNFIATSDSIEMAKGLLVQVGVDIQGLSDDEIVLRIKELYDHYLGVMADNGIDMGMVPWMDVILKGFYYEQQANQPPADPYDYFYAMAAKLNIDITGLTDDEVAVRVKQAEMDLQDANAAAGTAFYDAAGNFIATSDSIEMAKGLLVQVGVDIQGLSDDEIALRIKELYNHYLKVMADDGIDMAMVPWMDVILKGYYYEQ